MGTTSKKTMAKKFMRQRKRPLLTLTPALTGPSVGGSVFLEKLEGLEQMKEQREPPWQIYDTPDVNYLQLNAPGLA